MNSIKDMEDPNQDHPHEDQKRTRARQACETCRKKKTKCSGELPVCNNCALLGLECHYITVEKRRGPQKGYVRALESRLDNLQNLLEVYVDKISLSVRNQDGNLLGDGTGDTGNESDDYQMSGNPNSIPSSPIDISSKQKNDQGVSDNSMALVSKSHIPPARSNFQPFTTTNRTQSDIPANTLTTPKVIGHITLLEDSSTIYMGESSGAYFLRGAEGGTTLRIPSINNPLVHQNQLPPDYHVSDDIRNILLQIYFTCFHPYWPILHKTSFLAEYNQPNHGNIPDYLLDAMCSLASSMSNEVIKNPIPNVDFLSIGLVCHSRCLAKINSMIEQPNLYACQTMLILACSILGKGLTSSWMYRGIAINMAFELGLHRDLEIPSDPSNPQLKYLKSVQQRIWWNCYVLDRMLSVISGRPTSIDEEEFDTPLPTQSDGPDSFPHIIELNASPLDDELSLKFFIKFIELSQLYGKVSRNVYSVRSRQGYSALKLQSNIHHLSESLNAWHLSFLKLCPDSLTSSSPLFTFGIMQRIYYHTLMILLYRPLLPRPKQPLSTFAKSYYENSINSALKIVELISQNQSFFLKSGFKLKLYPLIVTITILTLGASSSETDVQVKDSCREGAISTLKMLGLVYSQIPLTCHAILSSIQMLSSNGIINEHNVEADWPPGLVTAFNLYHSLKSSFIDLNIDQLNKSQGNTNSEVNQSNQDYQTTGVQVNSAHSSDSPSVYSGSHPTPVMGTHSNPQTAQPEVYQPSLSDEKSSLKRGVSAVESPTTAIPTIPSSKPINVNNQQPSPSNIPNSRDISQTLLQNLQQTRNVRPTMYHPSNAHSNYPQQHPGMMDSSMYQHSMPPGSVPVQNYSNYPSSNLAASATFTQANTMNSINPHQQPMDNVMWNRMRNPIMTSAPNNQNVSPSAPQAGPNEIPNSYPQSHAQMNNPRPMMGSAGPGSNPNMMNSLGLNNPNTMLQNYTLPPQLLNIHNQIRQQNFGPQGQLNNPNTLSLMDLGWNMDPSYQFNYPFPTNVNNNNENSSQNS